MKTCSRFARIKAGFEREAHMLRSHSVRYHGTTPAKASATRATDAKRRMARALNSHYERCPECG
jgi:hypothetical protein